MKTHERKIFGIGAAVLMILLAFAPIANSSKTESGSNDGFGIIIHSCEFTQSKLEDLLGIVEYALDYSVSWPDGVIDYPMHIVFETESGYKLSWTVLTMRKPLPIRETRTFKMKAKDEYRVAGQKFDLIITNENVRDSGFTKFWRSEQEYVPTQVHLDKILPHSEWIARYETFKSNGNILKIPVFKVLYTDSAFPTLFGSDRLGWIGEFTRLLLDWGIAFSYFLGKFIAVVGEIILLGIEFYDLINRLIVILGEVSAGVPPTKGQIESVFTLLSAICYTFGDLLQRIKDLPIDPDDKERIELIKAGEAFLNFIFSYPWENDITIKGTINKCESNEKVTVDCRNIKNKDIKGGKGRRTIEPFDVDSTWESGDGIFFRNCQLTIDGSKHEEIKSPKFLSYAAPSGTLNFISGLGSKDDKDDSPEKTRFTLLQRILSNTFLARLLQLLNSQPECC